MLGISKEAISELPQALFGGRIIVINSPLDCRKAIKYLLTQPIVGLTRKRVRRFTKAIRTRSLFCSFRLPGSVF